MTATESQTTSVARRVDDWNRGHGIVFTTRDHPIRSTRGWTAAPMRHGVSTLHSGLRHTMGLVFHDAK